MSQRTNDPSPIETALLAQTCRNSPPWIAGHRMEEHATCAMGHLERMWGGKMGWSWRKDHKLRERTAASLYILSSGTTCCNTCRGETAHEPSGSLPVVKKWARKGGHAAWRHDTATPFAVPKVALDIAHLKFAERLWSPHVIRLRPWSIVGSGAYTPQIVN